ncbi:unnamed protein product [Cladocopium goreaui]|uniref:Uncharacterized protein n=1 Tax=Cladocopium goreaui TaxID=2562237 RepID=A0A9P1DYA7_9DINO|nr:unnamed protein product [Cladocopium goreaui]
MNWTMDYAVGEGGLCDEVEGPKNFFGDEKSPSHPSQVSGGEMYGSGDILSCWCTALGYQAILSNGGGPADAQDQSSSSP